MILRKNIRSFGLWFGVFWLVAVQPITLTYAGSDYSIKELSKKFSQSQYKEIHAPLLKHAKHGDSHAQYLLGLMYEFGLGVPSDRDSAFSMFRAAAFNPKSGGHNKAGEYLARGYLMDNQSKYYDEALGVRILRALSELGEVKSQLYMGGYLITLSETSDGKDKLMREAEMHFQRAVDQHNDPGAHFMIYILQKDRFDNEQNLINGAVSGLIYAANNAHDHQANAAMELAFYYQKHAVKNWENKYFDALQIAAELDDSQAHFLIGKSKMLGLAGEADYLLAKKSLDKAVKLGHTKAATLLRDVENRITAEAKLDSFQTPTNWIDGFLAIQSGSTGGSRYFSGSTQDEFLESSSEFLSSGGTSFRQSGRIIRGSDGSTFAVNGNTIQNLSTGTSYRYSGSGRSLMGTNGVKYNFRGNKIYGTDGSMCTSIGKQINCF